MVGSAIMRRLAREDCELLTVERAEVDLRNQAQTAAWVQAKRPHAVFLAAAKVGGILANSSYPADFLYDNLMIEANIIEASHQAGVEKLLFLGSTCIYPKFAEQPIVEDALLTGALEPTNQWYAIAKIAGIRLAQAYRQQHCRDFICAMPTNLYGPGDNFDLASSHVMPAIIRKAHEAKQHEEREIVIWGTGTPRREFLHVDDCADACVHLMKTYSEPGHVNVGAGDDVTILELTRLVCRNRRLHRRGQARLFEAGWHAAQADQHRQDPRARLVAENRASLRSNLDLRLVSAALRKELNQRRRHARTVSSSGCKPNEAHALVGRI